jgi:Fe-S-cluster-containing dehydrogenase component
VDKLSLVIFQQDCVGCHACEVACKQEHGLGVGPRFVKVVERSPHYFPIFCHHCSKPPCEDACPVEAISRDERGIALIDEKLCIGCVACVEACPFGAMQFDEEREVAVKCDLCSERLKRSEEPACSMVCPTRCISWGDTKAIYEKIERRLLQQQDSVRQ